MKKIQFTSQSSSSAERVVVVAEEWKVTEKETTEEAAATNWWSIEAIWALRSLTTLIRLSKLTSLYYI